MLELLKQYSQYVRFYDFDNLPANRDCFLLGDENINLITRQWIEFLSPNCDYDKWIHPNELIEYIPCHISSTANTHLDITLLLDRNLRFHTVKKILPTDCLIASFQVFTSETKPYIIVNQKWFNRIKNSIYSTYALIDFIGIRKLLTMKSEIPSDTINKIKNIVDEVSERSPALTFLSCADNIIIKSNWSSNENVSKYEPEKFINIVDELMNNLKSITGIDSYAILTQGVNYINEKDINLSGSPKNHLFMSSIAVPFIEAFEIDNNVREKVKNNTLEKSKFYIENSLYISMKRKFFMQDEPTWFKKFIFMSEKLKAEIKYIPLLTFENMAYLIEMG